MRKIEKRTSTTTNLLTFLLLLVNWSDSDTKKQNYFFGRKIHVRTHHTQIYTHARTHARYRYNSLLAVISDHDRCRTREKMSSMRLAVARTAS